MPFSTAPILHLFHMSNNSSLKLLSSERLGQSMIYNMIQKKPFFFHLACLTEHHKASLAMQRHKMSNQLILTMILIPSIFVSATLAVDVMADLNRIAFIINSQPNKHHKEIAQDTKDHLLSELLKHGCTTPNVFLTHEEDTLSMHGAWTYYPSILTLGKDYAEDIDWFVFLEENTYVNMEIMIKVLEPHKPDDYVFLGHALKDTSSVVIHHYDQPHLEFPLLGAGFILSRKIVGDFKLLFDEIKKDRKRFPTDFNIDPSYELAKTINHLHDGFDGVSEPPEADEPGLSLIHDRRLCFKKDDLCATYPRKVTCTLDSDQLNAFANKTFFGVKTCKKFHKERLSVIFDTWTKAILNIQYFSEEADPEYQTSTLPGVRNTERGHCKKTMSIIEHFYNLTKTHNYEWLVITDDDTILSGKKMLEQLSCYDPEDMVVLGQRYGFRVGTGQYGYDYPTGGGGMAFSRKVAERMLERKDACACRSDDAPDDMHLGSCLTSLGINMVHSNRFHQARPEDYHESLLKEHDPLSFHKFWNTDPRKMYDTWFKKHDQGLVAHKAITMKKPVKEEL